MRHRTDSCGESPSIFAFQDISANNITCAESEYWAQWAMFLWITKLIRLASLSTTKTSCFNSKNFGSSEFDGFDYALTGISSGEAAPTAVACDGKPLYSSTTAINLFADYLTTFDRA